MGKIKARGNGTGTVFKRGGTWTARIVIGWKTVGDHVAPVYRSKGGFPTKRDAVLFIPSMLMERANERKPETFARNMELWSAAYSKRVSAKTMECYRCAFRYFAPIHYKKIDAITHVDLQQCVDACGRGKRTKQLMQVVSGLIFKYALDSNQIMKAPAESLYLGTDETTHYAPLTDADLETIEKSGLMYSDYIIAMAYLGYRPTEFFGFKKSDYHVEDGVAYILGGIKTQAGKERAVTIPPRIEDIIARRLAVEGTEYIFPRYDKDRRGNLSGTLSRMPTNYFNSYVWKPMMEALGIVGKVPYATRHTYANKMKHVSGDEKDKAGLMGHASYETTRKHYQTTTLLEKKAITDQME